MLRFNLIVSFLILVGSSFAQKQVSADSPIYNRDTVIWFGADFSLFRLTNPAKVGKDDDNRHFIPLWIEEYKYALSNVKLASMLGVSKVLNDKDYTTNSFEGNLPSTWILEEEYSASANDIDNLITKYKSRYSGLGLVFMVVNFQKEKPGPGGEVSRVNGYFVWFNTDTREVYEILETHGLAKSNVHTSKNPNPPKRSDRGMVYYWMQGMLDATIAYSFDFSDHRPKQEED